MITTERLILRNILLDDENDIFEYASQPDVGPQAGWKPYESHEETLKIMREMFVDNDNMFGITEKGNNKIIGIIGIINDPKRDNPFAKTVGYSMGHDYWGRGYMTEAVGAVVEYAFEKLGAAIISAYCYSYNEASRRVIEKNGFEYEGTLNLCELRYDGVVLDNECYSISKDEWKKHKNML